MKKTLFLAAAALGFTTAASAQAKNVDLQFKSIIPVSNATYTNVNQGDTVAVAVEITNLGTEAVDMTDTVVVNYGLWMLDEAGYNLPRKYNLALAPNAVDTVYFAFINGVTALNGPNNERLVMNIKQNYNYDTTVVYGYGYDSNEELFNDPDIDAQGQIGLGNVDFITNFTFGTPNNNTSVKNLAQATLNVYPNPANNNINFTHNFAKATTATVKVLDLMGRVVMTEQYDVNAGAKNFNLNVAELANGSYFVELTSAEERGVTKFTIAK